MKTYEEIVKGYRKRQHDTIVDTISTGLTYVDELAVDTGLLEEAGVMTELSSAVCGALPFVVIAATEGTKVVLGRKPGMTGVKDGAFRMAKTGAAMAVGAAVLSTAGLVAAIPVTMGVRAIFDHYKSRALTGHRVKDRTSRLRELNAQLRGSQAPEPETVAVVNDGIAGYATIE